MVIIKSFGDVYTGFEVLFRWFHVLGGITWIGLLYFFNFVQVPAYAELSPAARGEAFDKLTWRALWWFRWAAALTFATGIIIQGIQKNFGPNFADYFAAPQGTSIAWGATLGRVVVAVDEVAEQGARPGDEELRLGHHRPHLPHGAQQRV